jgi:uncharacterized protein with GYD domain
MPKFLIDASYTTEGVKGVQRGGGTARREAVSKAVEGLGGRLESFYFAFGDRDVYVVVELPDNESALALAMAVGSTGAVDIRTTVLLSTEDADAAAEKSVTYTAPGG